MHPSDDNLRPDEVIHITLDEVEAVALPPPRRAPSVLPSTSIDESASLATGSLTVGLISLPVIGLFLGPIAIVLGALSLSRTRRPQPRQRRFASLGIAFGTIAFLGWSAGVFVWLAPDLAERIDLAGYATPSEESEPIDASPEVRAALDANCVVTCGGSSGSGVVIARVGETAYVMTNHHVIDAAGTPHVVFAHKGPATAASLAWRAPKEIDLVILKVEHAGDPLTVARFGRQEPLRVGEPVFAIGNPLGFRDSFTSGPLSAVRDLDWKGRGAVRTLQAQLAINRGNSGGGLYDSSGRLVGINTWMGVSSRGRALGFALSFEDAMRLVHESDAALATLLFAPSEETPP